MSAAILWAAKQTCKTGGKGNTISFISVALILSTAVRKPLMCDRSTEVVRPFNSSTTVADGAGNAGTSA